MIRSSFAKAVSAPLSQSALRQIVARDRFRATTSLRFPSRRLVMAECMTGRCEMTGEIDELV